MSERSIDRIAKAIEALESIRIFIQDCLTISQERAIMGNLLSSRDECDKALALLRQPTSAINIAKPLELSEDDLAEWQKSGDIIIHKTKSPSPTTPQASVERYAQTASMGLHAAPEDAQDGGTKPSPTMMPDAETKWAMTKVMREEFIRQYRDNERAKAPSIAMYEDETSPYLMLEAALSCDAFRNWMGGVGERCLPELPNNVKIYRLWQPAEDRWRCQLVMSIETPDGWKHIEIPEAHYGMPSPGQAILAALANIKTEG